MVPRAARSGDVVAWYVCGPEGEVDEYRLVVGGDFALQRVSGAGQNRSGNERGPNAASRRISSMTPSVCLKCPCPPHMTSEVPTPPRVGHYSHLTRI